MAGKVEQTVENRDMVRLAERILYAAKNGYVLRASVSAEVITVQARPEGWCKEKLSEIKEATFRFYEETNELL